jgi:hypothetical protein
MSAINIITAAQTANPLTAGKAATSRTTYPWVHPNANASSANISQAARDALAADASGSAVPPGSSANFKEFMAGKFAGMNDIKAMIQREPSDSNWAKSVDFYAQHDFTAGSDVLYDISPTMPGASGNPTIDGILRYSSGEVVTDESRAYATKQTATFQNQLREMIGSEKAKGTAASDILLKIFDLQGQQPARYRAMMAWPIASDFANSQTGAASGGVKA